MTDPALPGRSFGELSTRRTPARGGSASLSAAALVAAGTVLSYAIGWALGVRLLLPILNTLPALPFLYASLRRGRVKEAIARMLAWAAALAVCATVLSYWRPADTERLFINGAAYREEMFAWVRTGEGREGDPARFVPQHAAHAAVFCVLSLASGSLLSMPMGAVLMNYMGHYVGSLGTEAERPLVVMLLAWHPWSLVRIASFVIFGVVLAGPVLARFGRFRVRLGDERRLLVLATVGLIMDIVLKWALAPVWQVWVKAAVGW